MNQKDLRWGHDPKLLSTLSVIKRQLAKQLTVKVNAKKS